MENVPQGHYYDPPDTEEEVICEECNQPMGWKYFLSGIYPKLAKSKQGEYICTNPHCPSRFKEHTVEIDMARDLVEAQTMLEELKTKLHHKSKLLSDILLAYSK